LIDRRRVRLIGLKGQPRTAVDDELALDEPVCIFVNGEYHATLIATPAMREELVTGYLFTEGVIVSADDIRAMRLEKDRVSVELVREVDLRGASVGVMNLIVTACGSVSRDAKSLEIHRIESDLTVNADRVIGMFAELNRRSTTHGATGGTHAAMLCTPAGGVEAFAEDVGRHNAVDKTIGSMLLRRADIGGCVLVTTGRLSGEIVQKAGRARIPIVVSMTVPLVSGVRLAEAMGQTLVSLSKGTLKVYVNEERIVEP
jgi:FdhD protein